MGVYLEIVDLDKMYEEQSTHAGIIDYNRLAESEYFEKSLTKKHRDLIADSLQPAVVNKADDSTEANRNRINNAFYTRYTSRNNNTVIEDIPSCDCGEFTTYKNENLICPSCNTPVVSARGGQLRSLVWIEAPNDIPALINPTIYRMLTNRFTISNFDIIRWLLDYNYTTIAKEPEAIGILEAKNIPRGIINFYQHFDDIVNTLFSIRSLARSSSKEHDIELRRFLQENRHKVFCKRIPMPNKTLLVVETNSFATYMDAKLGKIIDALWSMVGIDSPYSNLTLKQKEARVAKAIHHIGEYNKEHDSKSLAQKNGIFRRNVFGYRAVFAFRTVISSITEPHHYRDIHIPWNVAMTVFQYHLIALLKNRKNPLTNKLYTPFEIESMIEAKTNTHCPLFRELFDELLSKSKNGRGIPCLANRNPSLYRNSIQLCFITKIKDDVTDVTTGISILSIRPYNADQKISLKVLICFIKSQLSATMKLMKMGLLGLLRKKES